MSTYLRIDINLFAASYLAIVFYLAYRRLDHQDPFNRLYFKGCAIVLALTLIEAATCVLNHQVQPVWRVLSTVLHLFLFILPSIITYYFLLFADALTKDGGKLRIRFQWSYCIPIFIMAVLVLLSPFFHLVYYVDESGVYHRGPLFMLDLGLSYVYLILGFVRLFHRRKTMVQMDFSFVFLFCFMPMVGSLVQGLVYGPLLMWPCSACALTILYLYLQERMVQTDYLTGAWTRPSFEHHMSQKLKGEGCTPFGVIYVDIDNLKKINDLYGHSEGDAAIKAAIELIRSVLRPQDVIARLGGDEFALMLCLETRSALYSVVERIHRAVDAYNAQTAKPYTLSFSLGADLFSAATGKSVEAIISQVDFLMYADKRQRHVCSAHGSDEMSADREDVSSAAPASFPQEARSAFASDSASANGHDASTAADAAPAPSSAALPPNVARVEPTRFQENPPPQTE